MKEGPKNRDFADRRVLLAEDQIILLKTKLDDQFIHLEIMAKYAGAHGAVISGELKAAMELTREKYGYSDMGLIDVSSGTAQLLAGGSFDATGRDYFTKAVTGERVIGYVERGRYSGITVFTLTVPVYVENRVEAVLFANFDPLDFTGLLDAKAYNGQSYSFVTDGDGEIIINSDDSNAQIAEGNVLEFFEKAELSDGLTPQDIAKNMGVADTLTFSVSCNGLFVAPKAALPATFTRTDENTANSLDIVSKCIKLILD